MNKYRSARYGTEGLSKAVCNYRQPHPSHAWQPGGHGVSFACIGIKDPNPPPFGEGQFTHSKQALGEWELWQQGHWQGMAPGVTGRKHLHFIYMRGNWEWVVRGGKSKLCGTTRCQLVQISSVEENE